MTDNEIDDASISFCKFCGSTRVTQTQYKSVSNYGGIGSHMVQGIQAQAAGFGGGASMAIRGQAMVYRPTWYCNTCKKIDCLDDRAPQEALESDGEFDYKFIIPSAFQELLGYLKVSEDSLKGSLEELSRRLNRNIHLFLRLGANPCKSGNIGFKRNILISSTSITVWVLMENIQGSLLARIVYDGGKSQCQ